MDMFSQIIRKLKAEMLAYDGIGIIVNTSNKVNSVAIQELRKIYTGNIVNWEKLKGESKDNSPRII